MQKRKKNLVLTNVVIVFCVLAFAVVSSIISKYGILKCYFFECFHLYCPGCGGTRALYALFNFDILASLKYNPAVILGGLLYVYYNVRAIIAIIKNDEDYFFKQKYRLIPIFAAIVIAYFIIRNILLLNGIDLIGDML